MIELQRKLIGDRVRNDAFAAALKQVIRPGESVVADLGSGTGFLSFLASRLGAKECHLIEQSPDLLKLSKALAKRNGITNCRFTAGNITAISNPVRADIVISETLGNFAYEEHIIEIMNAAHDFLASKGTLIPCRVTQFACPVTNAQLWNDINVWDSIGFDLSFNDAKDIALQNMYVKTIPASHLLDNGKAVKSWDDIDFYERNKSRRSGTLQWTLSQDTTVCALALWWESELVPGITLSTSPLAPATHWEQILLPLLTPVALQKGHTLTAVITSDTGPAAGVNVTWEVRAADTTGKEYARQTLDMRKGFVV